MPFRPAPSGQRCGPINAEGAVLVPQPSERKARGGGDTAEGSCVRRSSNYLHTLRGTSMCILGRAFLFFLGGAFSLDA